MLKARYGLMPGSGHHEKFTNRQDMCHIRFIRNPEMEAVFVGCDGCSSSSSSELGAGLTAYFATERLIQLILQEQPSTELEAKRVLDCLHRDILGFLRGLIALQPGGREYLDRLDDEQHDGRDLVIDDSAEMHRIYNWIAHNLLFTVVGGYFGSDGAIAFQRGDGGYCLDNDVHTEDHNNIPPYIAYAFFPKRILDQGRTELPAPGFTSTYKPNAKCLAIFSDGMPLDRMDEVWGLVDPIDRWDFNRNRLQKTMRQWFREGELYDDLFLAVLTREEA